MKILDALILVFLIVVLLFGTYTLWDNLPGESKAYRPFSADNSKSNIIVGSSGSDVSNKIVQFYPNMRYPDKKISYGFADICTQQKFADVERAFSILSESTVLSFYRSDNNPEIKVLCSDIAPDSGEKDHFIAGEGGPSKVVITPNFAVILSGKISLYRDEKCDQPQIAIHEILHALGFDHYNNPNSIMYPVSSCDESIDDEIISDINKLYSTDSLPDIRIDSLVANQSGRYLNFDINISNVGLAESNNVNLNIYSNNEKITNFSVGNVGIGVTKLLFVQNVRVPRDASNFLFVLESDDSQELDLNNNKAEISLA